MKWTAKNLPKQMHRSLRMLSLAEIQKLSELFRQEKQLTEQIDFLQERGDDFLKIYGHHLIGEPQYWGAFKEGLLAGFMGSIPTAVQNPFSEFGSALETDLFIVPQARQSNLVGRLFLGRISSYAYDNPSKAPMLFGVEQIPDTLETLCRLIPDKEGWVRLKLNTKLTQVFFTSKIETVADRQVQSKKLIDLPNSLLTQWLEMYSASRKDCFLSPIITAQTIAGLIVLDPDCEFIYIENQGQLVAGTLLLEQSRARQLLWPAKPSLLRARLQKIYQPPPVSGSEIKLGLISLSVDEKNGLSRELRMVFESLHSRAVSRGLHGVAFRDEAPSAIAKLSMDQFEFARRVLVSYSKHFSQKSQLDRALEQGHLRVRLENCFL